MMKAKKFFVRVISFMAALTVLALTFAQMPANAAEELTDDTIAKYINEVGILVNKARVEAGLKPVYILPELNEVAELRAFEVSIEFAHTRADHTGFETAIDTDEINYGLALENLAAGSSTPEGAFEQWRASKGHWAAIMNPNITHMGIGVYHEKGTQFEFYWQQTFVATSQTFEDQYLPSNKIIETNTDGDLNGDGVVDTYDYLYLTDYIRKSNSNYPVYFNAEQKQAADCFVDGLITSADAKVMQRYLLGEYKSLKFYF